MVSIPLHDPSPVDSHSDFLPPVSVSTQFCTESLSVCLFLCVCLYADMCLFLSVCVRVLDCTCCDDGTSSRLIMHLLRKCCQIMLTPQPGGPCVAGRDEWEGKECVCTLCIWATSPLSNNSTRQKLKLGECSRCLHEWVNLYHVCQRKIKALVYSGALLSLLISISKQRRWHGRELSHPSRPEQTGPDWTRGIIAGMWLHSTGLSRQWRQGTCRRGGHVCAFLIREIRREGGRERWMKMKKSIALNVLLNLYVCKNVTVNTKKNGNFLRSHKSSMYQVYT